MTDHERKLWLAGFTAGFAASSDGFNDDHRPWWLTAEKFDEIAEESLAAWLANNPRPTYADVAQLAAETAEKLRSKP